MVKLVTVLSVSFPEDAGTGWQYVQMLVCVPLCAGSEKRELVPSTGGWWPLTVCAFGSWGVDTPQHPHWTGASDCTGTACLPPLVIQHSRLMLCTSRWWPGWAGAGSQKERAGSVAARLRSPSQPCKLFGCWREDAVSVEPLRPLLSARDASHHKDAGELMNADDSERTEPSTRIILKKHLLR